MNGYHTPFIVAEVGGNHLGDSQRALDLIVAAHHAGADAVKFQCFEAEQMADAGKVIERGPWAGRNMVDLYWETHTPKHWFPKLFAGARACGMVPFASVFHPDDVDFMLTLGCDIFKISSFEITDTNLIAYAASKGKPLIISTGMATFEEIEQACDAAFEGSPGPAGVNVTLLKCTSAYPATAAEANLATMKAMQERLIWLGAPDFGLSDHTLGLGVAAAATALGASVIEKHLTIRRSDGGPDASFSLEPEEFRQMVDTCREAAQAVGEVRYGPTPAEASSLPLRRPPGGKRGDIHGL